MSFVKLVLKKIWICLKHINITIRSANVRRIQLFSDSGNIGRGKPSATVLDQCFALITSTTALKPCLQYKSGVGKVSTDNTCLIPDLDISDLQNFIKLFKRIRIQKLDSSLMVGKVECDEKTLKYIPQRPNIFRGNFPNAPHSSALGSIALLGAIGEMTKEKMFLNLLRRFLKVLRIVTSTP